MKQISHVSVLAEGKLVHPYRHFSDPYFGINAEAKNE